MEMPTPSVVQGIVWPPLPQPVAAARLALLFQLELSQWWSSEKIREHQFQQLQPLLLHCLAHVPYYQQTLRNRVKPWTLTEQQWQAIPILTRETVQRAGAALRAKIIPPGHGAINSKRTSGSTGMPIETFGTDITAFLWDVFTLRDHLWQQRDLSGKLAVIRYTSDSKAKPPHGINAENWGNATAGLFDTGPSTLLDIFTPVSQQAEWLQRERPEYLLTHPSVLQGIAQHCQSEGIELPSLREVRTISEALPDGLRELSRQLWNTKLVDTYSTIELGYLALQCPEHDHYHVQAEGVLLEVLDEQNRPCAPGEIGRVIVTSLHNFAYPLIRYEVGDYAEVGEPCSCGRGLPVLKRIVGRYRNLITLPNGERQWPQLGIMKLYEVAPVKQFQAIQHSIDEVEIKLIMQRPLIEGEREALLRRFHDSIGTSFHYTINEVTSLQRSAGGKYEEFISEVR